MEHPNTKVLLTGASGYIGGSVLNTLLASGDSKLRSLEYSVLLRNAAQYPLFEQNKIKPISFQGLEDTTAITRAASEHDIVINCVIGFATDTARALIQGLGERKRATGRDVFYIHTSGTNNLGDLPVSKAYLEPRYAEGKPFLDTEDIDGYHRMREKQASYPQRVNDISVVDTGLQENVPTYIMMPPTVWGKGTGNFNKRSVQIPLMCRAAVTAKQAAVIGEGSGVMGHVHVQDLAQFYVAILSALLDGKDLSSGKDGIYFSETGQHTWREIADGIAKAGKKLGVLDTDQVTPLRVQAAGDQFTQGTMKDPHWVELTFATNSRSKTVKAQDIWKPEFTRADFLESFQDEMEVASGLHD